MLPPLGDLAVERARTGMTPECHSGEHALWLASGMLEAMRVDVIDLGSNTFHLLAANVIDGTVESIDDVSVAVRLGERAFAKGRITDKAWRRGISALATLIDRAETRPVAVATGVFREVANGGAFIEEARRRFEVPIAIISGDEEARLTYQGVRGEALDPDGRVAVLDLGGGSLECVLGARGHIKLAASLPLGMLRLARLGEREIRERVATTAGPIVRAIRAREPDEVILSSGTARALLRLTRKLRAPVVGCMSAKALSQLATQLVAMPPRAIEALGVSASRSDVIGVGAVILARVVELLRVPFVRVANGSLREGLALRLAADSDRVARARSHATAWRRSA